MSMNIDIDEKSQAYGQVKEAFRALTKDDILKLSKSDRDFRSTNVNDAGEDDNTVGYTMFIFEIRCEKIRSFPIEKL